MGKGDSLVLVTGASGYIALHVIEQLLKDGYRVRGTVRSLKNEQKVKPIRDVYPLGKERLELVEADLLDEKGWTDAVKDCDYVLHLASPFITGKITDENILIRPAVEGTLAVLRACAGTKGKVKRVVLTSSVAAIMYGYTHLPHEEKIFTEADWTNPDGEDVTPYLKSKYLAERAAWDFVNDLKADEKFDLVVMNPGLVIGPLLHNTEGESAKIIKRIMNGGMPMLPKFQFSFVDVRDVAKGHIRGMELAEAKGQRFLLGTKPHSMKEVAVYLGKEFGPQGYSAPWMECPTPLLKIASFFDESIKEILPLCGVKFGVDNSKMLNVLKIEPIPVEKSLVDMGYSLIEKGLLHKTKKYLGPPESRNNTGQSSSAST